MDSVEGGSVLVISPIMRDTKSRVRAYGNGPVLYLQVIIK